VVLGLSATAVQAAEAETEVMGVGKSQLEFKAAWVSDSRFDLRERATPFLARFGLNETMELRLATDGHVRSTSAGVITKGWTDVNVGLRIRTGDGDKAAGTPATAWQLELGLPVGSGAFKAPGPSYTAKLAAEWALSETASIAIMPGITRQKNDDNRWYNAPYFAVTASKSWTPDFKTVVELVGEQFASQSNGGDVSSFKFGGVMGLTETVELEAIYTRGLNRNTPRHGLELSLNVKF
jgi:hypothetical protein